MSDEIKEILDNFKIYENRYKKCNETQFIIFYRDIHLLLDYITNLQEEKEVYKSRCEKAIEYIETHIEDEYEYHGLLYENEDKKELLNILTGGDKE